MTSMARKGKGKGAATPQKKNGTQKTDDAPAESPAPAAAAEAEPPAEPVSAPAAAAADAMSDGSATPPSEPSPDSTPRRPGTPRGVPTPRRLNRTIEEKRAHAIEEKRTQDGEQIKMDTVRMMCKINDIVVHHCMFFFHPSR